ncbi:alpha/beta hydrolase family protein [Nonomuraea dietziae]|uniref:alpha/beta hydrolase family protein n=1 Tax=Nonomuraea dietziae TaxID=65515 RepID=UPI0031DAF70F
MPFLIIHSENDWRCPVEQAQRLFVALKLRGVETELLLFPGEGHEMSRSGLPSHGWPASRPSSTGGTATSPRRNPSAPVRDGRHPSERMLACAGEHALHAACDGHP